MRVALVQLNFKSIVLISQFGNTSRVKLNFGSIYKNNNTVSNYLFDLFMQQGCSGSSMHSEFHLELHGISAPHFEAHVIAF